MVNGYSFMLIRQMVALVRRALAEVYTVPSLSRLERSWTTAYKWQRQIRSTCCRFRSDQNPMSDRTGL